MIIKGAVTDETCRICLKEGKLPIFGANEGKDNEELCMSIGKIGGIKVCANDPYPKFLCQSCHKLLQGALLFRKTAQISDDILKKQNASSKIQELISEIHETYAHDETQINATDDNIETWLCITCNLKYDTFQEYIKHINAEHKQKNTIEHRQIKPESVFETYELNYHEVTQIKTSDCKVQCCSANKNTLTRLCIACDMNFSTFEKYSNHMRVKHKPTEDKLKKTTYPKQIKSELVFETCEPNLNIGNVVQINTRPDVIVKCSNPYNNTLTWLCITCGVKCGTFEEYSDHMAAEHKLKETTEHKLIKAETCEPDFLIRKNIPTADYKVKHSTSSQIKTLTWLCLACDTKYDTLEEYRDHRTTEHKQNKASEHEPKKQQLKRVTCNICRNTYFKLYYEKHMRSHRKTPEGTNTTHMRNFMCDVCGKKFSEGWLLKKHILIHSYDLPFQCNLCPYRGRFAESLKLHMRKHTGEKPYQCEHCSSRFITKSNLNKHKLTHKKDYDFHCENCGKHFHVKKTLEWHVKVFHTGKHHCRICGKAFGNRRQMMRHELGVHKRAKLVQGLMPIYLKVEAMKQQKAEVAVES